MFKEEYDNFIRRCKLAEEVPMSSETISFYDLFVMMGSYFQDLEKSITSIEELKDIFNSENEYDECGYLKKCRSAEISNDGKTSKIKLSFAGGQSDYMLGHNIEIILSKSDDIPNNNTIGNISFFKDDDYIDVPSFIAKHYDRIYESLLTVERYAKILGTVNYFKHNIEKYIEIVKTVGDCRLIGIKAHTETVDKFKRLGIKAYSGSVKEKTDNFTIEMTYNDGGEITINITPHEEVYSGPYGLDCIDIKRTLYLEEDTMLDIMKRVPIKVENLDDTFKRVINESLKKCSPPQFVKKMYPLYTYNSVSGGKGSVHF